MTADGHPGVWPDVRDGRMSGSRAGCPGSKSEDELKELDFGAEIRRFRGFLGGLQGGDGGGR